MTRHPAIRLGTLRHRGFTLIELMIGSVIMLVVVIGALTVYSRSNKITVDQNQYAELQHDVRSAMHLVMRDIRMAAAGLPIEFGMYGLQGWDNESQGGEVQPDRLRIMGNLEEPLFLPIEDYSGGVGGGSANAELEIGGLERNPYPPDYYEGKIVLVLPRPGSGCLGGAIRQISHLQDDGAKDKVIFAPGHNQDYNPPGGLVADCPADAWPGGMITFVNVIEYWLDTTGTQSGTGFTIENGYISEPGVLYATKNNVHHPLAQNVENLQVRYNGDLNADGKLDGFQEWDDTWTPEQVARIRQIRVWILGRTANPFVGLGGQPPNDIHHYRRPVIANSPAATADDFHRRFLLESTANIRNMSLNLYNMGER